MFNNQNPNAINLRKMGLKALHKQYPTMKKAYGDYIKMMHGSNSDEIKDRRRQYIDRFEEAVCFLLPSKPQCSVLQSMLNEIEAEGENKYKILLRYLMHELTMNENNDEAAEAMPRCNRGKLKTAAEYAKKMIILEKTSPIPNMHLVTEVYGRRKLDNKNIKFVSLPTIGYTPMNGFRQYFIFETLIKNPIRFNTISWAECNKLNDEREIKLGYKLKKEINGQSKVIKVKESVSRKRKAPQPPAPSGSGL